MGRATEISRDEVKFGKFINRLRARFNHLFIKTLEKQLILKQIITQDDWKEISPNIKFNYAKDNYFAELKQIEIMNEKIGAFQNMLNAQVVGRYYSHKWVRTNMFGQDGKLIEQMDAEIRSEQNDPILNPPPVGPDGQPLVPPQQ